MNEFWRLMQNKDAREDILAACSMIIVIGGIITFAIVLIILAAVTHGEI